MRQDIRRLWKSWKDLEKRYKKTGFLRIAAGDVEPEEWETWWNSNSFKLEEPAGNAARPETGESLPQMRNGWGVIQYGTEAVDAAALESRIWMRIRMKRKRRSFDDGREKRAA